jgi:hypothetical protein
MCENATASSSPARYAGHWIFAIPVGHHGAAFIAHRRRSARRVLEHRLRPRSLAGHRNGQAVPSNLVFGAVRRVGGVEAARRGGLRHCVQLDYAAAVGHAPVVQVSGIPPADDEFRLVGLADRGRGVSAQAAGIGGRRESLPVRADGRQGDQGSPGWRPTRIDWCGGGAGADVVVGETGVRNKPTWFRTATRP